jgi:hypothetical protein
MNLYVCQTSYFTIGPVKAEQLKLSKCALVHIVVHIYFCPTS